MSGRTTTRAARLRRLRHALGELRYGTYLLEKLRAPANETSYTSALLAFVAAARGAKGVKPDLEDGYRSLAVVVAAEESARTRRVVVMPEE
ncbi:MAG: hypothetical protein LC785_04860 [Acidobacteria bacterium]|nr:hypothetical protein [Acidobacteriota bacterium]MCA1641311.1 hypothetical protein [Acidobacteriota bacterium]